MFRKFSAWLLMATLTLMGGCGGGSSSEAGTPPFGGGGSGSGSGSTADYVVAVELQRSATAITSMTSNETVQAVATVKSASGAPVPNVVVSFGQAASLVTFDPSSATALTDEKGVATVNVAAASSTSAGATTITASVAVASVTYTGSVSFQVQGTSATATSYNVAVSLQRSGTPTTSITSTETVQAVATVTSSGGAPVSGVVVTFGQADASLVTFSPSSATALTDANGVAKVDVAAVSTSTTGAMTINAGTNVGNSSWSGSTSFQIKAGSVSTTPAVPAAINFVSVTPAGTAIVVKGAGGNGRTESATLTFKVVDASNAPIEGAKVTFAANPANVVSLNIPSAVSDSSGLVTTTVQSGSVATSVVITATAEANSAVTGQSDTLVVSNNVAVQQAFEIVAAKYNLDGTLTGDSTTVSAYVADANGNPVPDGVAVSFTTDLGAIASSTLGGCLTVNGTCDVSFRVQNPRGNGLATVTATAKVGSSTQLAGSLNINMAGANGGTPLLTTSTGASWNGQLVLSSCKQTFEMLVQDSATGRSVNAGTTVALNSATSNLNVAVKAGSPVLDSRSFMPTPLSLEVDATPASLSPACSATGSNQATGFVNLQFTSTGGSVSYQRFNIVYPVQ